MTAAALMNRTLIAIGFAMALIAPAMAGPFEDAVAAHNRGDYETALQLWRPLADQGDAEAQYNLGLMYDNGRGLPQDYAEAAKWYRKAADQGHASAQVNLGVMYGEGKGVPQDYVQAHKWYNLAASRLAPGDARDTAVRNRERVASLMTPAQIAEAQRLAREWKPK